MQAVLLHAKGWSCRRIAEALGVGKSSPPRWVARLREEGESGLVDRREDNGPRKVDDRYLDTLRATLERRASDCGWPRPTWTRELLALTLYRRQGVLVSPATLSRALRAIGARRGRPRPVVICPLSKRSRRRRLAAIRQIEASNDPHEVLVYEDEVDIHLNPKIGWDWMPRGLQREVVTPGQNQKVYLAGALDRRCGALHVVEGDRKHSGLFLDLLEHLLRIYRSARRIHVVLDNYGIHKSRRIRQWLEDRGRKIQLHFLPPYSPNDNPIERVWETLHANVTRNHTRSRMRDLMYDVRKYLRSRRAAAAAHRRTAA